ncbi:Fur family ferric uptake transcriptional regulator [Cocleimonas flava]|uniref:Ferric uptake regulation protein n=1 Tax=Cocleimonas flava TaxID=634765 RepID=A0A4R1EXF4_9GAMM|nr:Fur family ferric uptake transcriptional regulator [Cocleimonas flava]
MVTSADNPHKINSRFFCCGEGNNIVNKNDIKEAGFRVTRPRVEILKLLETSEKQHYGAEEIYQELLSQGIKVGIATVYRVLTQFVEAGLVIKHNFEGDQCVFELDTGEHHDHMVDMKTGKIIEFHDEIIEQRQREIAEEHGFVLMEHSLTLYGEFKEK